MVGSRLTSGVIWLAGLLALGLVASSPTSADDEYAAMQEGFDAYQAEEMNFDAYKAQVQNEFSTYKSILKDEFLAYRGDILKVWDVAEVSRQKIFVGYSSDYKVKKVVDFQKGTVKISAVVPKGTSASEKLLEGYLKELLNETTQKAFKQNAFTSGVEKKLKKALPKARLQTAVIVPMTIVGDIATGKKKPSANERSRAATALMANGRVSRVHAPKNSFEEVITLEVKLPAKGSGVKAKVYLSDIKAHASKRKVPPALVLAVMETESAFNPMATSYVPAYGLMQIVPKSAGRDASKLVLGKDVVLSPSYLYNGKNNIAMGTAYLYILNDRYLASIKNPTSRLYCVIAAYNTGAGNVARAFTGTTSVRKAVPKINKMSPEKVYRHLMRKLPHKETKDYLKRVTTRMKKYETQ